MSSGELVFAMEPCGGFVVVGAGFEASVEDVGEPVGELAHGRVVPGAAGALGVVEGPGAGRGSQGGEGGVVLAGLAAGVAVRVVAEFAEDPGAEDGSQARLGQADLSV